MKWRYIIISFICCFVMGGVDRTNISSTNAPKKVEADDRGWLWWFSEWVPWKTAEQLPRDMQAPPLATPEQKVDSFLLTAATTMLSFGLGILSYRLGTRYIRRFKTAEHIPPEVIQEGRVLRGFVASVGDSDNFRFFHTPVPLQALWLQFRWRSAPLKRKQLVSETIHVRLAGIDAPESSAFGMPKQKYNEEAKQWLTGALLNRRIRIQLHRKDQYKRVVCSVWRPYFWFWERNVSLEMLQKGWATLYESAGAEYNGMEKLLRDTEAKARKRKVGMWAQGTKDFVHPADHKRKHLQDPNK